MNTRDPSTGTTEEEAPKQKQDPRQSWDCPECGATEGQPCKSADGQPFSSGQYHRGRVAERAEEKGDPAETVVWMENVSSG